MGISLLAMLSFGVPAAIGDNSKMNASYGFFVGHGGVTASHYFAYACDNGAYATDVWTEYRYWYGSWQGGVWVPGWQQSAVPAPSYGGCRPTNKTPGPIGYYRVCSRGAWNGCTVWAKA